MARSNRVFRVFVSSTFDDLKAEREALQERVFPELRERCRERGCRFQAIDLRWGVSHEASLDHLTMGICLEEIRRCREATPRPNFVVLLGDRYGWCPLPAEIAAASFQAIEGQVTDPAMRDLISDWYTEDDNARPPVYCLKERSGKYVEPKIWEDEVERPLREAMIEAASALDPDDEVRRLFTSAVEQEVLAGILDVAGSEKHVLGFFRNLAKAPARTDTSRFVEADPGRHAAVGALKDRLRERLGSNANDYHVGWRKGEPSPEYLEEFCDDVRESLWRVISGEVKRDRSRGPLEIETDDHRRFGRNRSRAFVGREAILAGTAARLADAPDRPVAIHGPSGCGKSALMGEIARIVREKWFPDALVVERYVGATAGSVDILQLLQGMCAEIAGREVPPGERDYPQLIEGFRAALRSAGAKRPVVVLIDALDQLTSIGRARELAWLPATLPPGVRVVVSTTPGGILDALRDKTPGDSLLALEGMRSSESDLLLDRWLQDAGRALQPGQMRVVRRAFEKCDLPLYFHLVFQQVRRWRSSHTVEETRLSPSIPGIIHDVLDRLCRDDQHGRMIVSRSLAYLAAARSGLTEDELLDVLEADDEVVSDLERRSFHELPPGRLPVAIWSRLYFDLGHYLSVRSADGASVLSFFHRQLEEVVTSKFLSGDRAAARSSRLARYFEPQRLERRGVSELPFAQARAGLTDDLEQTLTDFPFLEAKIAFSECQALIDEYDLLRAEGGGGPEWRPPLQRALRQAASRLAEEPSLLAGQLLGRLEAPAAAPVEKLLGQARDWRARTWLRPLFPSLMPLGPLERTLEHDGIVNNIAMTRDGTRLVSGSSDHTVRIWDVGTGAELHALEHDGAVKCVAISPDQKQVVSRDRRAIRFWDIATGAEDEAGRLKKARMPSVFRLAMSRDGRYVTAVTSSGLRVWDRTTRDFEDFRVQRLRWCSLSGDGRRAAVSQASKVMFYDFDTGERRQYTVRGGVYLAAISGDGRRVLISSRAGRFHVWDVDEAGSEPTSLEVGGRAGSLAMSFDGRRCLAVLGRGSLSYGDAGKLPWHAQYEVPGAHEALLPDHGRFAVTVVGRRSLQVFSLEQNDSDPRSHPHASGVTAVAISAESGLALSASDQGDIIVWDANRAGLLAAWWAHEGGVRALAFSPDGQKFVSAGADRWLRVWIGADDSPLKQRIGTKSALCVALTGEGVAIAVGAARGGGVRVRRSDRPGKSEELRAHRRSALAAAITPDGRYLASAGGDRSLSLRDLAGGGKPTTRVERKGVPRHIAVSADGRRTVYALRKELRVADGVTGSVRAFSSDGGHRDDVESVAMDASGERAVSAGRDGRLVLWNAASREALAVFRADSALTACAISADGATIVAGDDLGAVHLLRVEAADEVNPPGSSGG